MKKQVFHELKRATWTTMSSKLDAKQIWRKADTVCFDVDSTLVMDEGLDELANFCGVGQQVKEWTLKAMGGSLRFREALQKRLEIVKPTETQVEDFIKQHGVNFSKGVKELVSLLHDRGCDVYLVSGGFQNLIEPAAKQLDIHLDHVFSNRLLFDSNGNYAGFDPDQPTSDSGGKTIVAQKLKTLDNTLVFIGDGVTDMEARPPADCFIGYGGNVVRDKVKANADWFVTDFQELIDEIKNT